MRKTLILALSLALLVATLAGCASLPALTGTQAEQPASPDAEAESGAQPAAGPAIQPAIAGASNATIATGGTVRWEYLLLHGDSDGPRDRSLNELGAEGWQLVAVNLASNLTGDRNFVFFFKRPL